MAMPFCDGDGFGPITDNHVNTCFQQAVVGIVPVAFLAIFGTMRLVQVSALPRVMSPLSCRLGTKGFLSVMMYLYPFAFVVIDLGRQRPAAFTAARIIHDLLTTCAWLFSTYILWREFRCAVSNNYVLRTWWLLELVALVVQFLSEPQSFAAGGAGATLLQVTDLLCSVMLAGFAIFSPKNTDTDSLPLFPGRSNESRSSIIRWAMRPTKSGYQKVSTLADSTPTANLLGLDDSDDPEAPTAPPQAPPSASHPGRRRVRFSETVRRDNPSPPPQRSTTFFPSGRVVQRVPRPRPRQQLLSSLKVVVLSWQMPDDWKPAGRAIADAASMATFTVRVRHTLGGGRRRPEQWSVSRTLDDFVRFHYLMRNYRDQQLVRRGQPLSWALPPFPAIPQRARSGSASSSDGDGAGAGAGAVDATLSSDVIAQRSEELANTLQSLRGELDRFLRALVHEPALCRTRITAAFLSPQVGPRAFAQTGSEEDRIRAVSKKFAGMDGSVAARKSRRAALERKLAALNLPDAAKQRFRKRLQEVEQLTAHMAPAAAPPATNSAHSPAGGSSPGHGAAAGAGAGAGAGADTHVDVAPSTPTSTNVTQAQAATGDVQFSGAELDLLHMATSQPKPPTPVEESLSVHFPGGDGPSTPAHTGVDLLSTPVPAAAPAAEPTASMPTSDAPAGAGASAGASGDETKHAADGGDDGGDDDDDDGTASVELGGGGGTSVADSFADAVLSMDGASLSIASPFAVGFGGATGLADLVLDLDEDGATGGGLSIADSGLGQASARDAIASARAKIQQRRTLRKERRNSTDNEQNTHEGRLRIASRMAGMVDGVITGAANGGISLVEHKVRLRTLHNCFSGAQAVEWLMDHELAGTRAQAVDFAQLLLDTDVFVFAHRLLVYGATGSGAGMQPLPFNDHASRRFQDSEMCLYQFGDSVIPDTPPHNDAPAAGSGAGMGDLELADLIVGGAGDRRSLLAASASSSDWFQGGVSLSVAIKPLTDHGGAGVTYYIVSVEAGTSKWQVEKRYSEFRSLRKQLRAEAPATPMPDFPSKQRMATVFQKVSVEERRAKLESFLRACVEVPDFQGVTLACFLDPVLDRQLHGALPALDAPSAGGDGLEDAMMTL